MGDLGFHTPSETIGEAARQREAPQVESPSPDSCGLYAVPRPLRRRANDMAPAPASRAMGRADPLLHGVERLAKLGAWEYDVATDQMRWSDGLLEVWGLDERAPCRAESIIALIVPEDRDKVSAATTRAIEEGIALDVTFRIDHGVSGERCWLHSRGEAIRNDVGQVIRLYGATQDVTTRVANEEALRRAQLQARNAERLAKTGAWEVKPGGQSSGSQGFRDIFGFSQNQTSMGDFWHRVHVDDQARVRATVKKAIAEEAPIRLEYRITLPNCETRWVRSHGECQRTISGEATYVGAVQDITGEKCAELKLLDSQHSLEDFIDALTTFTAKLSPSGDIIRAGGSAARALGLEADALVGRSWTDGPWWAPELNERLSEATRRAAMGELVRLVAPATLPAGTITLDLSLTPVLRDGQVDYLVVEARDITEERRLQTALTAESQRLKRANADSEAFNHMASHDLKAPLRGIVMYSRALRDDHAEEFSDDAKFLLEGLRREGDRMEVIIADLLTLARGGLHRIHRSPVDISDLAREVVQAMALRDPARKVEVSITEGLHANGDPGLLRILFENLIGNAWKFTSRTPLGLITVGVETGPSGTCFFVKDNGVGFDPARALELFEPFKRLDTRDGFDGTGIGLSTVKRIVEGHAGRIWADGEQGKGATFRFTLESDERAST